MFGKSVPLDRHLFVSRSEIADNLASKAITVWAQNMLILQDILLGKARQALQERDENHLATQKPNLTIFSLGFYVLVEYPRAAGIVSHRGPLHGTAVRRHKVAEILSRCFRSRRS